MYLIPTYLAPSRIHGTGVFAASFIPAGTTIWQFHPEVDWEIAPEEMLLFPEPYQSRLRAYCYLNGSGQYVLCGDNARFMNHDDDPNCNDTGDAYTFTLRDIQPDEELTCDYRLFDRESAEKEGPLYE